MNINFVLVSANLHSSPTPACAQPPPLKRGHFEGPNGPKRGQSRAVGLGKRIKTGPEWPKHAPSRLPSQRVRDPFSFFFALASRIPHMEVV